MQYSLKIVEIGDRLVNIIQKLFTTQKGVITSTKTRQMRISSDKIPDKL